MKRIIVAAILVLCIHSASAKIWRVNNNNGIQADFTTLQAAHNGAAAGDTLHIEGSAGSYGPLTCSKKLVIIGPGYFLDENPNTQAIALSAIVETIVLNVGSDGTQIMGLYIINGNGIYVRCNDVVITRNNFATPAGQNREYYMGFVSIEYQSNNGSIPANNVIISQNFGVQVSTNRPSTGILITNNYIGFNGYGGENTTSLCVNLNSGTVALIKNNIFRRGTIRCYNSSVTNNIMYNGFFEGTGNLVSNNLANGTQFGDTNGNKQNVDMTTVFVGQGSGISYDGAWKLKPGSPAIGAGFGSTAQNPIDAGIYSGALSYVLSGMPPVPSIYFFENQPVGSNSDPIDVSVKVKSNN